MVSSKSTKKTESLRSVVGVNDGIHTEHFHVNPLGVRQPRDPACKIVGPPRTRTEMYKKFFALCNATRYVSCSHATVQKLRVGTMEQGERTRELARSSVRTKQNCGRVPHLVRQLRVIFVKCRREVYISGYRRDSSLNP